MCYCYGSIYIDLNKNYCVIPRWRFEVMLVFRTCLANNLMSRRCIANRNSVVDVFFSYFCEKSEFFYYLSKSTPLFNQQKLNVYIPFLMAVNGLLLLNSNSNLLSKGLQVCCC